MSSTSLNLISASGTSSPVLPDSERSASSASLFDPRRSPPRRARPHSAESGRRSAPTLGDFQNACIRGRIFTRGSSTSELLAGRDERRPGALSQSPSSDSEATSRRIYGSDSCSICCVNFTENTDLQKTAVACGHIFHNVCLLPWIDSRDERDCPLCREEDTASALALHDNPDVGSIGLGLLRIKRGELSTADFLLKQALSDLNTVREPREKMQIFAELVRTGLSAEKIAEVSHALGCFNLLTPIGEAELEDQ